jgi:hypothetical protein
MMMELLFAGLVPAVGAVALFSFLAVASWSEERRKERESFYRSEILMKLIDKPETDAQPILEMIREEENNKAHRRREGLKLGGFITAAVGLGLTIFMHEMLTEEQVWTVGLIPLLIGLTLILYAFFLAPKPQPPRAN